MIVDDLDFVCACITPHEANSPLIVDPYAVLSIAVSPQKLEPIAGRSGQVAQFRRAVLLPKLTSRDVFNRRESTARLPTVKPLSLSAAERLNHQIILFCVAFNVNQ